MARVNGALFAIRETSFHKAPEFRSWRVNNKCNRAKE